MTESFPVEHKAFYDKFENWRINQLNAKKAENGVYRLVANRPIGRLLDEDKEGVLYIGKGNILSPNNRIGKFINSLNATERRHSGGVRLTKVIQERFPINEMIVEITLTDHPEELEGKILREYNERFGELPPLNRSLTYQF